MKKIVKIGLVLIVLLTGFSKITDAGCISVTFVCSGGSGGTNSYVCGDTVGERYAEYLQLIAVICGEQDC